MAKKTGGKYISEIKKNVLVSISHGFQKRMFIDSGLLENLINKGYNIVIFTSININPIVDKTNINLKIIYNGIKPSRLVYIYLNIRRIFLWKYKIAGSLRNYSNQLKEKSRILYLLSMIGRLLPHRMRLYIDSLLMSNKKIKNLLLEIKPDILIFATGFLYQDAVLNYEAKKLNIKRLMIGQSWDNFSTKSYTNPKPDLLLCWGERMAEEAVKYNNFDPNKIKIVGVPHFDLYVKTPSMDESDARSILKLKPNYRTIVYGTSSESNCPDEIQIVKTLAEIVETSPNSIFNIPVQMIIRLHPLQITNNEASTRFLLNLRSDRIKVELPIFQMESKYGWSLSKEDSYRMSIIFKASDVAVNCFSTFSLDALANNLPVILVAFDMENKEYSKSVRRYLDYIHIKGLISKGGIGIANNFEELVLLINKYFYNPELNKKRREDTIRYELYRVDGKTVDRIIDTIEKI